MCEENTKEGSVEILRTRPNTIIRGESQGEYVVRGAKIKCSKGDGYDVVNLPLCHGVYSGNEPLINIKDMEKDKNIVNGFGVCTTDEGNKKCKDEMMFHINWINRKKIRFHIDGEQAVTTKSFTMCSKHGGEITFIDSGQTATYRSAQKEDFFASEESCPDLISKENKKRVDELIVSKYTKDIDIQDIDVDESIVPSIQPVGISREELITEAEEAACTFLITSLTKYDNNFIVNSSIGNSLKIIRNKSNLTDLNGLAEVAFNMYSSKTAAEYVINSELDSPFMIIENDLQFGVNREIHIINTLNEYNFIIFDNNSRKKLIETLEIVINDNEMVFNGGYIDDNEILFNSEVKLYLEKVRSINADYENQLDEYKRLKKNYEEQYNESHKVDYIGTPLNS